MLSKRKKNRHKKEYIKTFIHIKIQQQAKLNYIFKEYVCKFDQTQCEFLRYFSITHRQRRKKISKVYKVKKLSLMATYRTPHPTVTEYTFFFSNCLSLQKSKGSDRQLTHGALNENKSV